jgi:hypothetical protein
METGAFFSPDGIAQFGSDSPTDLMRCVAALRLRGGSQASFRRASSFGISVTSSQQTMRTDIDEVFPRGCRIAHSGITYVSTLDKAPSHIRRICIPRNAEILPKSCFDWSKPESITFENESRLTRIEESCFSNYSLQTICILRNVEILPKSCFARSKLESITFENESRLTQIEDSCFSRCPLRSICIPRNVEILPKSCFTDSRLESITFENESRLARIEDTCFSNCSLKSICIPRNVDFIAGSAFVNCNCRVITFDQNNLRFSIDRYFIVDKIENRLVRYFGDSVGIGIWQEIEILGEFCFARSKLESITFESKSRLTRIEDSCFSNCSLKSICIPQNVDFHQLPMKSIS